MWELLLNMQLSTSPSSFQFIVGYQLVIHSKLETVVSPKYCRSGSIGTVNMNLITCQGDGVHLSRGWRGGTLSETLMTLQNPISIGSPGYLILVPSDSPVRFSTLWKLMMRAPIWGFTKRSSTRDDHQGHYHKRHDFLH